MREQSEMPGRWQVYLGRGVWVVPEAFTDLQNLPLPQLTEATLQKHVQNLPLDEATSQGVEPRVCHSPAAEFDAKSLNAEEGIQVAANSSQNSKMAA